MTYLKKYGLVKLAFGAGIQAGLKANLKGNVKALRMDPKNNIFTTGQFSGKSRHGNLFPDEEGIRFLKEQKNIQRILAGGGGAADEQAIMAMNPNYHMVGGLAKVNPAYKGPWGREGMHNPQIKELLPKLFRKQREIFEPQIM